MLNGNHIFSKRISFPFRNREKKRPDVSKHIVKCISYELKHASKTPHCIQKTNNSPVLGPSYLKRFFTLHPDRIPTGNTVGMRSYFSPVHCIHCMLGVYYKENKCRINSGQSRALPYLPGWLHFISLRPEH